MRCLYLYRFNSASAGAGGKNQGVDYLARSAPQRLDAAAALMRAATGGGSGAATEHGFELSRDSEGLLGGRRLCL